MHRKIGVKSQIRKFLKNREEELLKRSHSDCKELLKESYIFLGTVLEREYKELTPEVTRKIELLEALMFAFIDHGLNLDLLKDIEEYVSTNFPGYNKSKGVTH